MFSSCDSDKRTGFERLSLIGGVWLITAYYLSNIGALSLNETFSCEQLDTFMQTERTQTAYYLSSS